MSTAPTTKGDGSASFMSGNDTIFSKVQIVHRLIDNLFYLLPVAAPLYKLVDVLSWRRAGLVSRIKYPVKSY